jgi:hypothetical protein
MNAHNPVRPLVSEAIALLEPYHPQGAGPGEPTDRDAIDDGRLEELADEVLRRMGRVLDERPVDHFGLIQKPALPPDRFHEVHDALYRLRNKPSQELACELQTRDRISDGFYNRGAFPDGNGGYFIDDYGMKGQWPFRIRTQEALANRLVLRTIDAVSRVLNRAHPEGAAARVVFVDRLEHISPGVVHPSGEIAIQLSCRSIIVTPPFCKRTRGDQEAFLHSLLDEQGVAEFGPPDCAGGPTIATSRPTAPRADRPDVWLVFLAAVRPNRAADYANHRFSYRVRAHAQGLRHRGVDAAFAAVEDQESFGHFEESYRRRPADMVMFSLYQHKQEDLERIHALAARLRGINPRVFLAIEGPAAILFKQFLCILPEINMLIRGEVQGILEELLELKRKDVGLSEQDLLDLSSRRPTGLFIRSAGDASGRPGEVGIISNADRSNVDEAPELIPPDRGLAGEWFCQRGCPEECAFCDLPEGGIIRGRSISAEARIEWMLERLSLEFAEGERPGRETLVEALSQQSSSSDLLGARFRLRPDASIGGTKVSITLLGQNETANRKDIKEWARRVQALGLQKYFRFKIADAAVASLGKERGSGADKTTVVDHELLRALRAAGVDFIGMGIENLQHDILKELRKGYTADLPIAVIKGLLEAGIDPGGIRGNIIMATPDSTMAIAHASSLLLFASPVFNSCLLRFGNGWGNARSPRVYTHGASLWSSVGVMRNPERADFSNPGTAARLEGTDAVVRFGDFFVPLDVPEYSIQSEISPIRSIDERIPALLTEFLYPTFYRYHIVRWFDDHLTDRDVERAMDVLGGDHESRQVASFVRIFAHYRDRLPHLRPIHVVRRIKADMVAQELFSFEDYEAVLAAIPDLPRLFDEAGVTSVFERGDAALVPGRFDPDRALESFADSGTRAQQVRLAAGAGAAGALGTPEEIERHYRARRDQARGLTYRLMAYPDVQQIEWLGAVYALDSDEELFKRVVVRMNAAEMHVAAAVESLIRDRLAPLNADEYSRLVKASKKSSNLHLFANAGLLRRLREEGGPVAEELRRLLDVERDPLVAKVIRTNLDEFERRTPPS